MSETPTPTSFDDRTRRELLRQRVLVLDGVLEDDNGTLLMTQLMSLAADDPTSEIALWIHSPRWLRAGDARHPRHHAAGAQ